jgi:hypothetical protein
MSLFIGNVSKKVTHQEFEDAFKSFGNCKIDLRVRHFLCRKDMHLYSTRVRDVLRRLGSPYRIPTSVVFDSTSSGPRTREGSMKTRGPRTIALAGEATLEKEAGERKTEILEDRVLSKSDMPQPTRKMKTTSRPLFPNRLVTQSNNYIT